MAVTPHSIARPRSHCPEQTFRAATLATLLALAPLSASAQAGPISEGPGRSAILWDEWEAPHVFAESLDELGWGFGWAQMRNHGDDILELYGLARGRGAEYWGEAHLASDRFVRTMGVPEAGEAALAAQPSEFRTYIQAFAAGMNAFAEAHPEALSDEAERGRTSAPRRRR